MHQHRLRSALAWASLAIVTSASAAAPSVRERDAHEAALASLVDAERAFASMAGERGIRDAFVANFADAGIAFEPAPIRLRETWRERPAPADPRAVRLAWEPAQAGVSRSLDMGYTTGPFTVTSAAQPVPGHGVFFSVWMRTPGGPWKVMLDAGISTPSAVDFAALGDGPQPHFGGRSNAARERARILAAEAPRGDDAGLTPNDYAQRIDAAVRLHRNGRAPIATRARVAPAMARAMARVAWTPIDARVSAACDMAFTYGRYRQTDHDGITSDGYYAHLWLRDATGGWRLAYDIAFPATAS